MTRLVLENSFESTRAMQNLCRLEPDKILVSGITEVMLNRHHFHNMGLIEEHRNPYRNGGGSYYILDPEDGAKIAKRLASKLDNDHGKLDLSLHPDPLKVINAMEASGKLDKVTELDISHCFLKDAQEASAFSKIITEKCPNLKKLTYDWHFEQDNTIVSTLIGNFTHLEEMQCTKIEKPTDIAFSKDFIQRVTTMDAYGLNDLKTPAPFPNLSALTQESELTPIPLSAARNIHKLETNLDATVGMLNNANQHLGKYSTTTRIPNAHKSAIKKVQISV